MKREAPEEQIEEPAPKKRRTKAPAKGIPRSQNPFIIFRSFVAPILKAVHQGITFLEICEFSINHES